MRARILTLAETASAAAEAAGTQAAGRFTATTEFTATRPCPLAGQVVLEGTHVHEHDRATRSHTSDLSLTKTHEACARAVDAVTITVHGHPDIAVEAHHERAAGRLVGPQTLSMVGEVAWSADDGREGTCTIDVSAVFDPDTATRTVTGTFCDRTLDRTTSWGLGEGRGGAGMGA